MCGRIAIENLVGRVQFTPMQNIARTSPSSMAICGAIIVAAASVISSSTGANLPIFNPSFEEGFEEGTKINNWLMVPGPEGNWGRWDSTTGNLVAAEGKTLLYTNSTTSVAVQLIKDAPIEAGKYRFSIKAACPENISTRPVQMAIYAIPTAVDSEPKYTLLGEKTFAVKDLTAEWKTLEVIAEIPVGSPHIGHYFQINITSGVPDSGAPLPAQVDVDDVKAERLE